MMFYYTEKGIETCMQCYKDSWERRNKFKWKFEVNRVNITTPAKILTLNEFDFYIDDVISQHKQYIENLKTMQKNIKELKEVKP
jgi:hypothetical protein